MFAVVDRREEKSYDGVGVPIFSADSRHLIYHAVAGHRHFVVVDGKEEGNYEDISGPPIFSPDGRRVAFGAKLGSQWSAVVDGKTESLCRAIDDLTFSPDSRRVAYAAKGGGGWAVVVDGKEEELHGELIRTLIFSPDSRRVAYAAKVGANWLVVVDGKQGKLYDEIINESLIFSPDARRVAYVAKVGDRQVVVVDGKEEKPYDDIDSGEVTSPIVGLDVVNGRPIFSHKSADGNATGGYIFFSPDSRRVAYRAKVGGKWIVVVDGKEGKPYDDFGGTTIVFDSGNELHYLAARHTEDGIDVYLVEEVFY
jgi:outer membrane lipoprotein-sorting protein